MGKKVRGYELGVDENRQILPVGEEQKAMVEVPNELTKQHNKEEKDER